MKDPGKPYFLNVDLDIVSRTRLDSVAAALGKKVIVLYSGPIARQKYILVLESSRCHKGPDATIHALCSAVERLSPAGRRLWSGNKRDFNVGYELRASESRSTFTLRPDTLQRIAGLGASLTVTYYRGQIGAS
jgi:hypothetical protein